MKHKGPPLPWEIRNWSLTAPVGIQGLFGPSMAPEQVMTSRLRGEIWYRPLYADGVFLMSSPIVGLKGEDQVVTMNSAYKLCAPSPEYEEEFPNARARVLNSLTKL